MTFLFHLQKPMPKRYPVRFSIVIPALNEEKNIHKLLGDLAKQTYQNFEVIVVDGQSEDNTVQKAQASLPTGKLKVLSATERNVSSQRNQGASASKGEWIIFMDADNRLPRFFLEGISYRTHQHKKIDIFTTWMKVDGTSARDRAIERVMNSSIEIYKRMGKPSAVGALIGCKRKVLSQVDHLPVYLGYLLEYFD